MEFKIICDLVENRQGIIAILDTACYSVGNITDAVSLISALFQLDGLLLLQTFLAEMDKQLATHAHYRSRAKDQADKTMQMREHFRIQHYAGQVNRYREMACRRPRS